MHRRRRDRISIFEKVKVQAKSSKFQTPSSKEAPGTKLKKRVARRLPASVLVVRGLRFGTSLELGLWCLVFRSAVAQKLRCPAERGWRSESSPCHWIWGNPKTALSRCC